MENRTCAIISESPMCFAWGFDEEDPVCSALRLLLLNRISLFQTQGIIQFAVSVDSGIGLFAAEAINSLRETNPDLELICHVPYERQAVKWSPELRDRYYETLYKCISSSLTSPEKTPTCDVDTMLNAIDQSETVIAVCAGEEFQDKAFAAALRYAERTGRTITLLKPPKLS